MGRFREMNCAERIDGGLEPDKRAIFSAVRQVTRPSVADKVCESFHVRCRIGIKPWCCSAAAWLHARRWYAAWQSRPTFPRLRLRRPRSRSLAGGLTTSLLKLEQARRCGQLTKGPRNTRWIRPG